MRHSQSVADLRNKLCFIRRFQPQSVIDSRSDDAIGHR